MLGIPLRHLARYSEIISVLIRYDLGYFVMAQLPLPMTTSIGKPTQRDYSEADLAQIGARLRGALTELGPTFIKMGQLASTRSDILPQPLVAELTKLQDQVRPLSFADVRHVLESSLQQSLDTIFREFDPKPLAAASIGQVHQAVLTNGDKVAVKVQRPHLREVANVDLEIFKTLVAQLEQRTDWGKRYPLRLILDEFGKSLLAEMDFMLEGRNTEKLAQLDRQEHFIIPKIYWEFSNATVLTQEFMAGVSVSQMLHTKNVAPPASDYNLPLIAKQLSQGLLQQILRDGYFHGDPHPGNILFLPGGKIALIDFGIVGTLTDTMRSQLAELVIALIHGAETQLLDTLSQMGIVPEQIDRVLFQEDVSVLRIKHFKKPSGK